MIKQGSQYGLVTFAFERVRVWSLKKIPCLGITNGRGGSFVAIGLGPLRTFNRIMGDRIVLTQMIKEGREGRELAPDRGRAGFLRFQFLALGQDMGTGHRAHGFR